MLLPRNTPASEGVSANHRISTLGSVMVTPCARLVTIQAASPAQGGSASPHSTGCGEAGGTVDPALDNDLGSRRGLVRTAPAGLSNQQVSMPLPGHQWSKGQYGAYDRPAQGRLPAAVCIQPESGQFPVTVLSVVRQYAPCGVT